MQQQGWQQPQLLLVLLVRLWRQLGCGEGRRLRGFREGEGLCAEGLEGGGNTLLTRLLLQWRLWHGCVRVRCCCCIATQELLLVLLVLLLTLLLQLLVVMALLPQLCQLCSIRPRGPPGQPGVHSSGRHILCPGSRHQGKHQQRHILLCARIEGNWSSTAYCQPGKPGSVR